MPLEVLHRALVPLRRRARGESAEVAPAAGLRILLARVEPVLAGSQLADHGIFSCRAPNSVTGGATRRFRIVSSRPFAMCFAMCNDKMKAAEPLARPRLQWTSYALTRWASSACAPGRDGSRAGRRGRRTSGGSGRSGRARSRGRILPRPCSPGCRSCRRGQA